MNNGWDNADAFSARGIVTMRSRRGARDTRSPATAAFALAAAASLLAPLNLASAFAQATEPGPAPQIFAPGVISAGAIDGAPTFSPDGKLLYFERTNSKWTAILGSRRVGSGWSTPVLASFSGTYSDQQPAFSPDGSYLLFVSSRPAPDRRGSVSHLYRVDHTPRGWSEAVELPAQVNISDRVFKPSVADNGDIYFMSDTGGGGQVRWRLFRARREGLGYAEAEPLSFSGPGDGDVDPYIAPDQRFLVFSSNTRSDLKDGHEHLFVVERRGTGWSPVSALRYRGDDWGADDGEAQVSGDRRTLYFTSNRIVPPPPIRNRRAALAAMSQLDKWNNSNSNVWTLPFHLPAETDNTVAAPPPVESVSGPPAATPAKTVRPTLPESLKRLNGTWQGTGAFANGKPLSSVLTFEPAAAGEAILIREEERAPGTFRYSALLSVDSRSGELVLLMAANNKGGARVFAGGVDATGVLTFTATRQLHAWFGLERFVFAGLGGDRFTLRYEISRDGLAWTLGDQQAFARSASGHRS